MRICVTGHRGYIGSAFVDFAQRRLPEAKWLLIDKETGDDLLKGVRKIVAFKPEIIFNFAGSSGEQQCARDSEAWELNAKVPAKLASFARPRIFVQASTCSLYGLGSTYTESKQYAEEVLKGLANHPEPERSVIAFRFGTVYGANPRTMRWDLPLHKMIRDVHERGEVSVPSVRLMRPWLKLQELCRVLTRVAQDYEEGIVPVGYHCVPLVSENRSLQFMAGVVLAGCGGARLEYREHEPDLRNYAAPALLGGVCSLDDIYEIKEMLT